MGLAVMPIKAPIQLESLPDSDVEEGDDADAAATIMLKLTAQSCGVRLDKVLSSLVPQYSRSRIQQWIDAGFVTIDGQPARAKDSVFGDETIVIQPQPAPDELAYQPEPMALPILHEDADILVINKPAGMVVH